MEGVRLSHAGSAVVVLYGPAILAVLFPIIGVLLSAWSFSFADVCATPDRYAEDQSDIPQQVLDHGSRRRARWSASVLFKSGALMVIAGVLMNFADSHGLGLLSLPAFAAYALGVFVVGYLLKLTRDQWLDRREDTFSAFYGRDVFPYYKDREAVRTLFFRRNPTPYWSIFKRSFGYNDLTAEELATTLPLLRKTGENPADATAPAAD
jgi:hypothetical protein